jgi:hypothetical protein
MLTVLMPIAPQELADMLFLLVTVPDYFDIPIFSFFKRGGFPLLPRLFYGRPGGLNVESPKWVTFDRKTDGGAVWG